MLLLVASEEDAFWILSIIAEDFIPGYWSPLMHGALSDQRVLARLVKVHLPKLDAHFGALDVDLTVITLQWYLCLFVGYLQQPAVLRLLDNLMIKGREALHIEALAVLTLLEPTLMNKNDCSEIYRSMNCVELDQDLIAQARSTIQLDISEIEEEEHSKMLDELRSRLSDDITPSPSPVVSMSSLPSSAPPSAPSSAPSSTPSTPVISKPQAQKFEEPVKARKPSGSLFQMIGKKFQDLKK
jgi:hypothetical protein